MKLVGYRKFIATMSALASSSALVWFDKIEPQVYSAVVIATVGVFVMGNVAQKFSRGSDAQTATGS